MKFYGKGTKWCIAGNYPGHEGRGQEYFNSYKQSRYTDYYVFIDKEGKPGNDKWCVCPYKNDPSQCDIWNAPDNTVSAIEGAPTVKGLPYVSNIVVDGDTLIKVKPIGYSTREAFEIPNTIKHIGRKAMCATNYGIIHIPDSVIDIGSGAFAQCEYLTELIIPNSVTQVGNAIVLNCDTLKKISLGEGVTSLTKNMIAFCDNLSKIVIKGTIENIDNSWIQGSERADVFIDETRNAKLVE